MWAGMTVKQGEVPLARDLCGHSQGRRDKCVWEPPALMCGSTGENGGGAVGAVRSRTFKKHLLCTCTIQTARETLWPPAASTQISPTPTAPRGFRQPPSCPGSSAGPGVFRILATRGRALPRNQWHRPCSAPLADSPLPCGQTASRRALLTRTPRDRWQSGDTGAWGQEASAATGTPRLGCSWNAGLTDSLPQAAFRTRDSADPPRVQGAGERPPQQEQELSGSRREDGRRGRACGDNRCYTSGAWTPPPPGGSSGTRPCPAPLPPLWTLSLRPSVPHCPGRVLALPSPAAPLPETQDAGRTEGLSLPAT